MDRYQGVPMWALAIDDAGDVLLHSRGVGDSEPPVVNGPIDLGLPDRYILSRLQAVTQEVDTAFTASRFSDGAQALYRFFWTELCDWYIELCKPQLAPSADPQKRRAALVASANHGRPGYHFSSGAAGVATSRNIGRA